MMERSFSAIDCSALCPGLRRSWTTVFLRIFMVHSTCIEVQSPTRRARSLPLNGWIEKPGRARVPILRELSSY